MKHDTPLVPYITTLKKSLSGFGYFQITKETSFMKLGSPIVH